MNASDAKLLELALKKQQLQFASDAARARVVRGAGVLPPVLHTLDGVVAAWRWLTRRPEIPVAVAAALLVLRPRRVFAWSRRAFGLWQLWRRARSWLAELPSGAK